MVSSSYRNAPGRRRRSPNGGAIEETAMVAKIETILTPTDFSTTSEQAVEYALDLARRLKASVHLVHVVAYPIDVGGWPEAYGATFAGLREQLRQDAALRLAKRAKSITGLKVSTDVREGSPARAIADAARDRKCDLIVMGTHGSGGFTHLMLGSVAERVVRTAPCPVLTVSSTRARKRAAPAAPKRKGSRVGARGSRAGIQSRRSSGATTRSDRRGSSS
jgi:nucleotide-binding universal stress UspA family protein